jgi:hypothetical protein
VTNLLVETFVGVGLGACNINHLKIPRSQRIVEDVGIQEGNVGLLGHQKLDYRRGLNPVKYATMQDNQARIVRP